MRITLVTNVTQHADLNKRLHYALQALGPLPFDVSIWMRDKQLAPPDAATWADRWRWLCERHGLRFEISLHHAQLIQESDVIHVPDVPQMRHQAHQHYREHLRILSLHGLDQLSIALANREVELVLSPLYQPLSKPLAGPLLDRKALETLKRPQRERIHLMGGLTAKRIAPLLAGRFAGYNLMGAWLHEPENLLTQLGQIISETAPTS